MNDRIDPRKTGLRNNSDRESPRILFIDDEEGVLEVMNLILTKLGYRVKTEPDPSAALELFEKSPESYDLVITDITMPDMTGDFLANRMLTVKPDLPIIACSGSGEFVDKETLFEIGVRKYMLKPFTIQELEEAIDEALNRNAA